MNEGRDETGFTLLEVLIGLALMALIAALAAGALGGLAQTGKRQERHDRAASVEPVETYLRRLLADIRPVRQGAATAALLAAETDRLSLISGYAPKGTIAGLQRVTLRLVGGSRAGRYDLEEVRTLHRDTLQPNGERRDGEVRTRLLADISALTIRYLALGTPTAAGVAPPVWLDRWVNPAALPRLIRIDIAFPPGDVRGWQTLDIAVLGATGP